MAIRCTAGFQDGSGGLQLHSTEGDKDHEIAQTLAATVPNGELIAYPGQALVGDEFRAARRS